MNKRKSQNKNSIIYWTIAIVISLAAMLYQRATGPTYPLKVQTTLNNQTYNFKLLRSHGGKEDCKVEFIFDDKEIDGSVFYKRYKSKDPWTEVKFNKETVEAQEEKKLLGLLTIQPKRTGNEIKLSASLPWQPPAGKLSYYIQFNTPNKKIYIQKEEPVVIRFKGAVPTTILAPHIFFMILTILFSSAAAIFAINKHKNYLKYSYFAIGFVIVGGLILGPIVQKYAFNEYWAGIPYGYDLTDNKTLIMFLAWVVALIGHYFTKSRWFIIGAYVVVIGIYLIPHSTMGSELNYETGSIEQSEM